MFMSVRKTGGHLIYPLDDTYIHMAIAKNVALHHVWGVTGYGFSSSTSSPLWTGLLAAGYSVFGVNDVLPFILNLLFGTFAVIAAYELILKYTGGRVKIFIILTSAILAAPLPALTISGMEHVLHAFLAICFIYFALQAFCADAGQQPAGQLMLSVTGAMLILSRYEGLFMVFVVCVLLMFLGRIAYAFFVGAVSLLPVSIYGFWCAGHGWYFLPNSVLLKGRTPGRTFGDVIQFLAGGINAVEHNVHILILLAVSLAVLLLAYRRKICMSGRRAIVWTNWIFLLTALLHMQFARTGWFFRYEAYLVFIGIVVTCASACVVFGNYVKSEIGVDALPRFAAVILLAVLAAFPFVKRGVLAFLTAPSAAENIYGQQYQMGLFLRQYYNGRAVALNDIGAACYLADIRLLDLWGLGSMKPATLKMNRIYTSQEIYESARRADVEIAIVYDKWFAADNIGGLPWQWIKIGQWQIPDNVIAGDDTVSFYCPEASEVERAVRNLRQFSGTLPADVKQLGRFAGQCPDVGTSNKVPPH